MNASLRYVVDEHLQGTLWRTIVRHNLRGEFAVDAARVGDLPNLPLGITDPQLLLWAEREQRILVTADKKTMPRHLEDHLTAGRHSPGIFMVRPRTALADVLSYLVLAAYASDPDEWRDRIQYI